MTNHIYQNHLDQVNELLSRTAFPLPELKIIDPDNQRRGLQGLLAQNYDNLNLVGYKSHGKKAAAVAI